MNLTLACLSAVLTACWYSRSTAPRLINPSLFLFSRDPFPFHLFVRPLPRPSSQPLVSMSTDSSAITTILLVFAQNSPLCPRDTEKLLTKKKRKRERERTQCLETRTGETSKTRCTRTGVDQVSPMPSNVNASTEGETSDGDTRR